MRLEQKIKAVYNGFKTDRYGVYGWGWKKLSSIRTSVYILCILAFFYVIGTVFPQGEKYDEYVKAGGKYLLLVNLFDLLDFFASPVFVITSVLLLLNLAVCTCDRYAGLFATRVFPKAFEPTHTLYLTQGLAEANIEVRRVLRENLGLRLKSNDYEWMIMEKGLPYRWLTWLYHAGIIVCFTGFLLTYLFAFEGNITLKPGQPRPLSPDTTGRVQSLWKTKDGTTEFSLYLDEFITDYVQTPVLDYPKDRLSRLAIGLGWKVPSYGLKDDSLSVKDWKSRLKVKKSGRTLLEKTVFVNDPLRYGGYTFYQEGFEQKIKIRVDSNPILLDAKTDEELIVPGIGYPLKFGTLRAGTLYKIDGGVDRIKPFTAVKRPVKASKDKKYEEIGRLEAGAPMDIDGRKIEIAGFEESSVLSYRYDPGTGILWWGGIFVIITMCLRFFGRWQMVAYRTGEADGIVFLELNISTKGLSADAERLAKRIEYHLTIDDLKPSALPPSV